MILPKAVKNQERLFPVTRFDVMEHIFMMMDKAFLNHVTNSCR